MPRPSEPEPILHPAAEEPWFKALPKEKQDEFHRTCQDDSARDVALRRGLLQRYLRGALSVAAIFGLFDCFCPGRGFATVAAALMLGALVGLALEHVYANHLTSGAVGLAIFFLFQWVSRNGLSGMHIILFFPVGAFCAILGLRRE